jgi:heptosyltransferase I
MKRILLIKLTSLGDLIHALPALSDAHRTYPGIIFDWVVDANFQEVATWHPAVDRIFTTNHRKWRQSLLSAATLREIYGLAKRLRKTRYDLVIDGQGNFKSALLTLTTKGPTAGFDRHSVRERFAHLAYQKGYRASKKAHAVARLRQLFAQSLGYQCPISAPDFMLQMEKFVRPRCELPPSYLVFVHNASWATKLWPEAHWCQLIEKTVEAGYTILLPWGNREEQARAQRLGNSPQVHVLPKLTLSEIGYVIARAQGCVCMDTGLSHLTAALDVPAVTLYGATDSGLIGASGANQLYLHSNLACSPCNKKKCRFPVTSLHPPCLGEITPDAVFRRLLRILHPEEVRVSCAPALQTALSRH